MTAPIITTHTTAITQHTQQQLHSTLIKAFNKDSKKRLLKKAIKYVVTKNNFCDCLSFYKNFFKIKQASTVLRRYRDAPVLVSRRYVRPSGGFFIIQLSFQLVNCQPYE